MKLIVLTIIAFVMSYIKGCVTIILGTEQEVHYNNDISQAFSDSLHGSVLEKREQLEELIEEIDEPTE